MTILDGVYTYTTIATGTTDEAVVAATTGMRLMGYSIRETAAAVATVNVCHGAAGTTAMTFENLAASTSVSRWFGPQGLPAESGVWIERLTGTTTIVAITKVA